MGKLHEVLAVISDRATVANKLTTEAIKTLKDKPDHFTGHVKTLHMFDESRSNEEANGREVKEMVTTVQDKLDHVWKARILSIDAVAEKEATNQIACASVVLDDGTTILEDVPVTELLALETELTAIRNLYEHIPTLLPGVKWVEDPDKGHGVYRAAEAEHRIKTEQIITPVVLYEATDKHPAQVKERSVQEPVGEFIQERYSGMWTPAKKAERIRRIDALLQAVRKARTVANGTEIHKFPVGQKIKDYIDAD